MAEELGPGLYESLITEGLAAQLGELVGHMASEQRGLRSAEAADRIAWHLSRQIERALADVSDDQRVEVGLTVARKLLARLGELIEADRSALPIDPAKVLHASSGSNPMAAGAHLCSHPGNYGEAQR